MKEETKTNILLVVPVIIIIIVSAYAVVTVEAPEPERKMERGYIVHVEMGDAVYFKDGTILKGFLEKDYIQFIGRDGKEVTLTYDEDWFGNKTLVGIVETPIGEQVKSYNNK